MRHILAAALLCASFSAGADLVAENGRDSLRLAQAPCSNEKVLALIREEHRDKFKAAVANVAGQRYAACWADPGEGYYITIFEDGEVSVLSITIFVERGI
jgi:hypothetical protein